MYRRLFFTLFLFVLLPVFLLGQGRVKGKVTDLSTGEVLIGANIIVVGTSYGAATDVNGEYVIRNLTAGTYTLKASYLGYQAITTQNVRVNSDLTTEIDFQLPPEDISVGTVTIVAERPLIQKDATSSIRTVTNEDIQNLPVRGVTNIATLQAGVVNYNGVIHVRGSRGSAVGYYLEGVSITNPESGNRAVTIANDAVEELQVETGGFGVQYGGSTAGLIRTQLRSGGTQFHTSLEYISDNVGFHSKNDFARQDKTLGAYWYGNNETSFSMSGPLFSNKVKFFYNLDYNFDRSQAKKGYPGFDFGPTSDGQSGNLSDTLDLFYPAGVRQNQARETYTNSGTLTLDFNPVTVRLAGTYTTGTSQIGGSSVFQIARNRTGVQDFDNGTISAKVTHVLSPELFYELSGGVSFNNFSNTDPYLNNSYWDYGDSVANAKAGITWKRLPRELEQWQKGGLTAADTRYVTPSPLSIFGFSFSAPGSIPVNYAKGRQFGIDARLDLTYLPSKHHTIKLGGIFKQHTLRRWGTRTTQSTYASQLFNALKKYANPTAADIKKEKETILIKSGVNNYGYDIYGNEFDGSGFDAPHKPVELGFYISDRIEFSDLILNLGVRYDYFDMDNLVYKDPTRPELAIGNVYSDGNLNIAGYTKVPTFSGVSPRISVSFPVTDMTVFHAGFGKYVQQPALNQAYMGYHSRAWENGVSFFFPNPTGANLRPIRKTHYEFGFNQQLTDFMAFDITGYYDDIKGQVTFDLQDTDPQSPYSSYNILKNGDFATTKGVEMQFTMRRYERLAAKLTMSFSDARGTGSFPNSNAGIVGAPLDGTTIFRPQYVSPLTYDRPFKGNLFLDYRFGMDDGPSILHGFGINVLASFSSGHPFTRGIGGARIENDSRFRQPVEPLNSSLTPSTFNIDLKVDKTFSIWESLSANIYLKVLNLFDTRNVEDVYIRSGAADDDGYISNPDLGGLLVNTYGTKYESLYKTLNIDYNGFYSDARQVLFGIRLEY
ncbi:TonB-dependent Receptor Plug Domain protein [bacterium BMS3Abin04]|nr:TonB-dependent Receptor Plug Domain protein [bacterium BMS3Abin04]